VLLRGKVHRYGKLQPPFWSHSLPGAGFTDNLWREPVPFDLSSHYGLALAHHGDYCWLSAPYGVWRAGLAEASVDLTADVVSLRQETLPGLGKVTIELRNDSSQYSSLPSPLGPGCQLEISPGYVTAEGNETSPGQAFSLETYEYISSGGGASLILYGMDGGNFIKGWEARYQFRWNKTADEANVRQLLEAVGARAGLRLEAVSQSEAIGSFYPDFTVLAGSGGESVIGRLLSFVPDALFIEGNKALIVNPQSSDAPVYSYGQGHPVTEGKYRSGAWKRNRVQVEGSDSGGGQIVVDVFSWEQVSGLYDRIERVEDRNIATAEEAGQRGEARLREAAIGSGGGVIRVPVNCGQQLYDVIDITDSRAGLEAARKRVLGITLIYEPRRGVYEQRLTLGEV
jgi:hypothetical protein